MAVNYSNLLNNTAPSGGLFNLKGASIGEIVSSLVPVIFTASGIALLVYLIIGGLSFMTAGSDPKKMESAKEKITTALIGFVIVFVSYWIVQIIGIVFGIQVIKDIFR